MLFGMYCSQPVIFSSHDICILLIHKQCNKALVGQPIALFCPLTLNGEKESESDHHSLSNWLGLKGVLHKAAESTAGVCVSGVRAKFSKSSQCVSQWQHMLDSLQCNSRTHKLTCKHASRHTGAVHIYCDRWACSLTASCMSAHMHSLESFEN